MQITTATRTQSTRYLFHLLAGLPFHFLLLLFLNHHSLSTPTSVFAHSNCKTPSLSELSIIAQYSKVQAVYGLVLQLTLISSTTSSKFG